MSDTFEKWRHPPSLGLLLGLSSVLTVFVVGRSGEWDAERTLSLLALCVLFVALPVGLGMLGIDMVYVSHRRSVPQRLGLHALQVVVVGIGVAVVWLF